METKLDVFDALVFHSIRICSFLQTFLDFFWFAFVVMVMSFVCHLSIIPELGVIQERSSTTAMKKKQKNRMTSNQVPNSVNVNFSTWGEDSSEMETEVWKQITFEKMEDENAEKKHVKDLEEASLENPTKKRRIE